MNTIIQFCYRVLVSDNPIYQKHLSELLHFFTLFDYSCEEMSADLERLVTLYTGDVSLWPV